jgi:hypothetical protein
MAFTRKQKRRLWWLAGTVALLVVLAPVFMMAAVIAVRYYDVATIPRECGPWSQAEVDGLITDSMMRMAQRQPAKWAGFTGPVFAPVQPQQGAAMKQTGLRLREVVVRRTDQPDEIWIAMVDCARGVEFAGPRPIGTPTSAYPPK